MKKIIFLKLGGSLITDKTKPFSILEKNIEIATREIREALKEDKTLSIIIGTGTGSFGHYPVQQYGIEEGLKTDIHKYGFCSVHDSVSKLNGIVVDKLLKKNIKAFSFHPSSMMTAKNRKISQFYYEPIVHLLELGVIPVVHGDMVYDEVFGSTICSVEMIFSELVVRFHELKTYKCTIIHAGLTDGVFDSNSNTIPEITNNTINSFKSLFFDTKGYDVTGGMKSKVGMCLKMVKYGVESMIINGTIKGNIRKTLLSNNGGGTRIK